MNLSVIFPVRHLPLSHGGFLVMEFRGKEIRFFDAAGNQLAARSAQFSKSLSALPVNRAGFIAVFEYGGHMINIYDQQGSLAASLDVSQFRFDRDNLPEIQVTEDGEKFKTSWNLVFDERGRDHVREGQSFDRERSVVKFFDGSFAAATGRQITIYNPDLTLHARIDRPNGEGCLVGNGFGNAVLGMCGRHIVDNPPQFITSLFDFDSQGNILNNFGGNSYWDDDDWAPSDLLFPTVLSNGRLAQPDRRQHYRTFSISGATTWWDTIRLDAPGTSRIEDLPTKSSFLVNKTTGIEIYGYDLQKKVSWQDQPCDYPNHPTSALEKIDDTHYLRTHWCYGEYGSLLFERSTILQATW